MSRSEKAKEVSRKAVALEKQCEWAGTAELHQQAFHLIEKKDLLRKGEIQERIGYCFHRAALQAETKEEFKWYIGLSVEAYEEAAGLFEKLEGSRQHARVSFCRAKAAYCKSWLAQDPTDRAALLDECRALNKRAAKAYDKIGDQIGHGRACNELLTCLLDRSVLPQNSHERKRIWEETLEYGERAIHALAETGDELALTRAYYQLSWGYTASSSRLERVEKRKNFRQKALRYAEQAVEVAERTGDSYLISMSNLILEGAGWSVKADAESSLKQLEKTLELAAVTHDNILIAQVRQQQAARRLIYAGTVEDSDKRREEYHKVIQAAEDAVTRLELLSFPHIWAYYTHPSGYVHLALDETDLEKKRILLKKATEIAREYLPKAKSSGAPIIAVLTLHSLSAALDQLAAIETETEEKRRLLTRAAEYREVAVDMVDRVYPFAHWDRGIVRLRSAGVKVELAKMETANEKKKDFLTAAVMTGEDSMNLIKKGLEASAKSPLIYSHVGKAQDWFGGVLNQLYVLTGEKTHLERALKICKNAVETWRKAGRHNRIAESHWQIAKLHDRLGEHLKSAQAFAAASKEFSRAAENLLQLKAFYTDHETYMQAWSEIEQARHYHARGQYGEAREHYSKAADLHKSTERWNHLSKNYSAWARLQEAEDSSRREQSEEARVLFQKAASLFVESKVAIKAALGKIEIVDEKEMANDLVKASDIRREYCLARIALEEAKILDGQGDHAASSRKYGDAAEGIQNAIDATEDETNRHELLPMVDLSRAWQMMTRAEAEASPDLYLEASRLFDNAKEHSLYKNAKVLALGHSSLCRALEAGARFEAAREPEMLSLAKRHLEAAANYYVKAGFKTASEYAKAAQKLFDAYLYMHKADAETDLKKKAELYQIAEKFLQISATSYMKAKQSEKSEEVERLLETVEQERQLAVSLTEMLHAQKIVSTTTSFSTLSPSREKPAGLERFEHVDIQAHLTISQEVTIEEEVDLRLDLVNVAKNFGLIVRVDNLVPPGFKVATLLSPHNLEENSIDMKGKRLDPLKVESIKLRLKATEAGVTNLRPKIVYVDDAGKFKTCRLEPANITVHPKLKFEFKLKAAQTAFDFLTRAFVQDYMKRRMPFEKSGWRTLMEIVKHAKLSKSNVYGTKGRRGRALSELERRGLVEERIFPGERGRGGKILRARIAYGKETIKRYIDHYVMKIEEK